MTTDPADSERLWTDPALAESDAEKLLLEWYQQWLERDDMPAKMDDGLHVRTAIFWRQRRVTQVKTSSEANGTCPECRHPWSNHNKEIYIGSGAHIAYPEVETVYECNHYVGMGNWCGCQERSRRPLPMPRPEGFVVSSEP